MNTDYLFSSEKSQRQARACAVLFYIKFKINNHRGWLKGVGRKGFDFMQNTKTYERLVEITSELTGIPEKSIEECGIQCVFQTPWIVKGMTNKRKQKLELLQDFVSAWNEVEFLKEETFLNSASKAGKFFCNRIGHKVEKEYLEIAFLNKRNQLIGIETTSGTIDMTPVYSREIIKCTLSYNAANIMMAHSHPSGSLKPSVQDISVTKKIYDAAKLIEVTLLDHLIVAGNEFISFREKRTYIIKGDFNILLL